MTNTNIVIANNQYTLRLLSFKITPSIITVPLVEAISNCGWRLYNIHLIMYFL